MEEDYEEDYYDEEDNEDSEPLILSLGKDGKAEIHKSSDFVKLSKEDMELVQGFIKENQKEFTEYCKLTSNVSKDSKDNKGRKN